MDLLSPAGNFEGLKRAVAFGADAVYLGLKSLNARNNAGNFSDAEFIEAVRYCKIFGVKVYAALNVSVTDGELEEAERLVGLIDSAGADGIIITDTGLLPVLEKRAPYLPVRISTQAGIHNVFSAKFFEKIGADAAVLSRETSAEDIREIKKETGLSLEYFVQGALCVSFSGGCLAAFSRGAGSGNRGTCSQPCRLKYTLKTGDREYSGYMLSTADLNLSKRLKELDGLGISSLKIEGRMRRPEYTAEATLFYRSLLDGEKPDLSFLRRAYNRGGYTEGYAFTDKVMSPEVQSHIGEECGRILKIEVKNGYSFALVKSNIPLEKGDGLKILRDGHEVGGADLTSSKDEGGGKYYIPVSSGAKAGDSICLTTDAGRNRFLLSYERRLKADMSIRIETGKPIGLILKSGGAEVEIFSEFIPTKGKALPIEEIEEQLKKLGGTNFRAGEIKIEADESAYLPKSAINDLRRKGIDKLTGKLIELNAGERKKIPLKPTNLPAYKKPLGLTAAEAGAIGGLKDLKADFIIYRPGDYDLKDITAALDMVKAREKKLYLALPKLLRYPDRDLLNQIIGILKSEGGGLLAENFGIVGLARENKLSYGGGIGLNIFNTSTLGFLGDADFLTASPELAEEEIAPLLSAGCFYFSGRLPIMTLAHCPIKLVGGSCSGCKYGEGITYREGKRVYGLKRSRMKLCSFTLYAEERAQNFKDSNVYRGITL
jgi:Collagenase and related proteases